MELLQSKEALSYQIYVTRNFTRWPKNFGMMASYGEPNNKAKSATTGVTQQLEGHPAELEVKKPRVQLSEQEKPTGEEEKTQAT
jgi:hypothetical protein